MEVDNPASLTPDETLASAFDRGISSCRSLSRVPFCGGEGNGVWKQGSNNNREYEQLETDRAGTETSLVGWCRPWGEQTKRVLTPRGLDKLSSGQSDMSQRPRQGAVGDSMGR